MAHQMFSLVIMRSILLASLASAPVFAQSQIEGRGDSDSLLASRLLDVKHIGLEVDERLSGFAIHVYTPKQLKEKIASLHKFHADMEAFNAKIASLDQQRREARERHASGDELKAITETRNREQRKRPSSPFAGKISLYNVMHIGSDYLEIEPLERAVFSTLIPFSKICSVVILKPGKEHAEGSDAKE